MCTLLCVCPPRVESPFPSVLSKSCNQILLAFKVLFSRNSSSLCRTPRLGSLTWGSEPSLQWVDFCGVTVLRFVSHPPSSYGMWFYCDCAPPTVSFWLLHCLSLDVGYHLWVSSGVFLSMIVQQLVVIPVLLQEGVRECPSTLVSSLVIFFFSFSVLNVPSHSLLVWNICIEKSADNLMEVLIYVTSLSSLAAFKIPSFSLTFDNLIINIMSLNISPIQVQTIWGPLDLMDLDVLFSSHVREVFSHYCFKYTFCLFLFLFLFSFWNSHKSCRLSSLFFILFFFLLLWVDNF